MFYYFRFIIALVISIIFTQSSFAEPQEACEIIQEQSCVRRATERLKVGSLCAFGALKWALFGSVVRALKVNSLSSALWSAVDFTTIPLRSLKTGLYEMILPWQQPIESKSIDFTCPITDKNACVRDEATEGHALAIYKLMKDIHRAFRKAKVPYFAQGGTLLGCVRHGGFIPWDDDLDIVVTEEYANAMPKVLEILNKKGYKTITTESFCKSLVKGFKLFINGELQDPNKVSDVLGIMYTGWRVERWFDRPKVHGKETLPFCDIFLMKKGCDRYYYASGWPEYSVHKNDIYPLKEAKFGSYTISIPRNPYLFLDAEYYKWSDHMQKYGHGYGNAQVDLVRFTAPLEKMSEKDYLPAGPFGPLN